MESGSATLVSFCVDTHTHTHTPLFFSSLIWRKHTRYKSLATDLYLRGRCIRIAGQMKGGVEGVVAGETLLVCGCVCHRACVEVMFQPSPLSLYGYLLSSITGPRSTLEPRWM